MILMGETIGLCLFMWLVCFLGTGSDEKNLKSLDSYPLELQKMVKEDPDYKEHVKPSSWIVTFISNFVLFSAILFLLGLAIRKQGDYLYNFIALLIIGQVVNLFDLLVIDILWWRNIKRIRFTKYMDKALYRDVRMHVYSYLKGVIMFTLCALLDASILMLF